MRGKHNFEGVEVEWIDHAWLKFRDSDGKVVHVDPWSEVVSMDEIREMEKADIIVSTHDHFDHFDKKAIQALKKRDTVLVCTEKSENEVPEEMNYKIIRPGSSVAMKDIHFRGVPAYNVDKFRSPGEPFHPEGFCTGVIFELDGVKFYHGSDTDPIDEMETLQEEGIDVAFLPVGGTYTMDQEEALEAIKMIQPRQVVPIHYGYIDETTADPGKFRRDVEETTGSEAVIIDDLNRIQNTGT